MDYLPYSLQLEILNRLESTDLARCRLVSKTLYTLSYEVRSMKIICTGDRLLKSMAPETKYQVIPFKLIVKNLLLSSSHLENITIGFENICEEISSVPQDMLDEFTLTDVQFMLEWLPKIGGQLKSISITNFNFQWQQSDLLLWLISSYCNHLVKLELKNVCLSTKGLKPMPALKILRLESVMFHVNEESLKEDLNKVNECFPSLRVLNLIEVKGLENPKIHLLHLKTCQCWITGYTLSLTIQTPKLIDLNVKCDAANTLIIKAPLLTSLHLSIGILCEVFEVENFINLKHLRIQSNDLYNLIKFFPECNTVEKLVLDSPGWVGSYSNVKDNLSFEKLMSTFPNTSSLSLRAGAWVILMKSFLVRRCLAGNGWKRLKQLKAYLVIYDVETTRHFTSSLLERFTSLTEMTLLVHRGVPSDVRNHLICSCIGDCPRIKWRWGLWNVGKEDTWLSDGN